MQYLEDVDPIIDFSIAKGFSDRVVFCQLNIPIRAVVKLFEKFKGGDLTALQSRNIFASKL